MGLPSQKSKPRIRVVAVKVLRARRHIQNHQMLKIRKPKSKAVGMFPEESLKGNGRPAV